jgi:hypothetical protein
LFGFIIGSRGLQAVKKQPGLFEIEMAQRHATEQLTVSVS